MKIKQLEGEEWRPVTIHGYPDYLVSNMGRVYSKKTNKLMTPQKHQRGYLKSGMSYNGDWKAFFTHRLVALAFIPNPNNYPQINHKDSNRTNNHVSNLEWCTEIMNQMHKYENGKQWPSSNLDVKKVLKIREKFKAGHTRRMLGGEFGVAPATIKDIVLRRTWKHV